MIHIRLKGFKALLCGTGIACLVANSIVLYGTFLWAYFSNNYVFAVNINAIGEAHIEFILLPTTIILGSYAAVTLFRHMPRRNSSLV